MRNRRQTIRLNESTLNRIIKESVKKVLNEGIEMDNSNTDTAKKRHRLTLEEQEVLLKHI